MQDMGFGLYMTVFGMGSVFLLLALLWGVLTLIGVLDRPKREVVQVVEEPAFPSDTPAPELLETNASAVPAVQIFADGLDSNAVAAIAIAVITHAQVRRHQAAPAMRSFQPGSHMYASRWVSMGRSMQNQSWKRR